jgi:hypothetical protein
MFESYKFFTFQKNVNNKLSLISSTQETMSNLIPENNIILQNFVASLINPIIPAIQKTLDVEKFILFQEKIFTSHESISSSINLIPQIINQIVPTINESLKSYKFNTFHNSVQEKLT